MRHPKIAPMAKSKVSHMISNGFDQFEKEVIGAKMSSFLSFSQVK